MAGLSDFGDVYALKRSKDEHFFSKQLAINHLIFELQTLAFASTLGQKWLELP
jgi:hypothetical protein